MNRRWLALAPLAVFACAPPGVLSSPPASPAPTASAPASAPPAPSTNAKPPVAAAPTQAPALPLTSARLQASSCAQHADVVKSRIAAMRAEMDARYKDWHDMQPECWAEDRRREAERLERERCLRTGNCGLGLSGIGSGGGGRGEGIGLGSIGTIGHGSDVGTAQITSKTNVQVAGVDEPDIVKTDGRYVYMVANGALRIVEALTAKPVSTTRIQGHANDMVVEGDRLVVFVSNGERAERCTYGYDCEIAGDGTSTTIHTYDLKDRAAPRKIRTIGLTGSLMTARRIG
ncbi:MAG: beta-propeller domain-containing protein, partial [Myxococcales bacterium]|nr:beta-propeller domain-containing protein [Myxococcales bacterium]